MPFIIREADGQGSAYRLVGKAYVAYLTYSQRCKNAGLQEITLI